MSFVFTFAEGFKVMSKLRNKVTPFNFTFPALKKDGKLYTMDGSTEITTGYYVRPLYVDYKKSLILWDKKTNLGDFSKEELQYLTKVVYSILDDYGLRDKVI